MITPGCSLPLIVLALAAAAEPAFPSESLRDYRAWISEMKQDRRGPFSRIRWFCNDGAVLPPEPYACRPHGGGHQHGQWSEQTETLRADGYLIASFLAGLDAQTGVEAPEFTDWYTQLLTERYLVAADDGWIFRRALFYRGAIQEEDERAGARSLLQELASRDEWVGARFLALRSGARLLPHGEDSASVQRVRQLSASLSEQDPGFRALRAKIHGSPDAADAERVRAYAASITDTDRRNRYELLAAEIDGVYQTGPISETLREVGGEDFGTPTLTLLREAAAEIERAATPLEEFRATGKLLAALREQLGDERGSSARLALLDLSLRVESAHFRAGAALATDQTLTRRQRVAVIAAAVDGAFGAGLLRQREREALQPALTRLSSAESLAVSEYFNHLRYLGLAPAWATANLRFHFGPAVEKLAEIEPQAEIFLQDQLRGSPMLAYSRVIDKLAQDADRLRGVSHTLFGQEVGVGLRALNPGLARGVLRTAPDMDRVAELSADGIYVLPETVAELPPVGGILTAGEGNPVSHIQLLARNLGIPNVAVSQTTLRQLEPHDGERIVLAASPRGVVSIRRDDEAMDRYFEESDAGEVVIRPDLEKLDLGMRRLVSLDDLRAGDSGRIVGPKAAKLGELKHAFPDKVADGIAIPFGLFRALILEQPYRGSDGTIFEWLVNEYRRIEALPPQVQADAYEALRAEIYDLVSTADPGPEFRSALRQRMKEVFGTVEGVGVFIRSDTNVEDLPGFTGAGLNLTLPNVTGFDNILRGLQQVWASPFTRRAFAWRNSHMEGPEHVYPAILLLKTVPAQKSGVMITAEVETGNRDMLTVSVSEGVGGAVEGQAAESLRIDRRTGEAILYASAAAPTRYVPLAEGGVASLPASGADAVLQPPEIRQLVDIAAEIPRRFPPITDEQGEPAPADVEFAFLDGRLQLLQIRPFLESRKARGSSYLRRLDEALSVQPRQQVPLSEVPQ